MSLFLNLNKPDFLFEQTSTGTTSVTLYRLPQMEYFDD
jgi:hypothetical protein